MQVNILFQVFGIILSSSCLVKGGFYADQVFNLFETHFTNKDNACWKNTGASQTTDDKVMAIALVNVYTQECTYYNGRPNDKYFYEELNAKLRDQTKEEIWLDTEQLLNNGLDILGIQTWKLLYRACKCDKINEGHTFTVNAFWSTSLLPEKANEFLDKDSIFFEINAIGGANISGYSAFESEKEILLQSNRTFYVTEYVEDEAGIKLKKEGVEGKFTWKAMKAFAVVTGIIPASSSKSGYCDCSGGAPSYGTSRSAASMPTSFLSAVIFVAFRLVY